MRILQVINIGVDVGGAEKLVALTSARLRERGHDVRVLATTRLLPPGLDVGAPEVFATRLLPAIEGGPVRRIRDYAWYQAAARTVRDEIAEFGPDVVHLHTIGEFSPAVLAATRGLPRVLTVHGPEDWTVQLARWNLPSAPSGRLSPPDRARLAYLHLLQRPLYRRELRHLDLVLAPSVYYARAVRPDLPGVPIRAFPNGTLLPPSAPLTGLNTVLYVGRLAAVKGVRHLIDGFAAAATDRPELRLVVVGDGPEAAELHSRAAATGARDRIHFTGWATHAEVARHLADAAVVAIPSVWPENYPTVALEALGIGRGIIASDVGGLPELVTDQLNGRLLRPGDPDAIAEALGASLGHWDVLTAWGRASADRAGEFTAERYVDRIEAEYRTLHVPHTETIRKAVS